MYSAIKSEDTEALVASSYDCHSTVLQCVQCTATVVSIYSFYWRISGCTALWRSETMIVNKSARPRHRPPTVTLRPALTLALALIGLQQLHCSKSSKAMLVSSRGKCQPMYSYHNTIYWSPLLIPTAGSGRVRVGAGKLKMSAPKQRLRVVHSRSEVQKRWRSDYRL